MNQKVVTCIKVCEVFNQNMSDPTLLKSKDISLRKMSFPKMCNLVGSDVLKIVDYATLVAKFDRFLQKEGIKAYAANEVMKPTI